MAKLPKSQFRFRRNDTIGSEGAEQDSEYLRDCFVDRGDLDILQDCENVKCIIVGRTGTGKTALLSQLATVEEHVVELNPEDLSLQYLSNSTMLPQLSQLGVNLSLFYKLLWRHIFAVELVKARHRMRTETETKTFLERLAGCFGRGNEKDRAKEKALNYLVQWGGTFWEETEYRVKEVTTRLEEDVKSSLGAKASLLEASLGHENKMSLEEKGEIINHVQKVVNAIQLRELNEVIRILKDHIFDNTQARCYLTIDRLDDNWVEDAFRYHLIKALIEAIKEFNHAIPTVKVIVALRRDLLDRVIHLTRDTGFQEEKYQPLYLDLRWSREDLLEMLDRRISKLVRRQYTSSPVSWPDIMADSVSKQPTDRYLLDRTLYRPRDLIVFFNSCIEQADSRPEITATMIKGAEGDYSRRRLNSLGDEWRAEYPELVDFAVGILKKRPAQFNVDELNLEDISQRCLDWAAKTDKKKGVMTEWAYDVAEARMPASEFRARLVAIFYKVGVLGVKLETYMSVQWSFLNDPVISSDQIRDETPLVIRPMFYRALGAIEADGAKR